MGYLDNIRNPALLVVGMTGSTLFNVSGHLPVFMALFAVHTQMFGMAKNWVTGRTFFYFTVAIPSVVAQFTIIAFVFGVSEYRRFPVGGRVSFGY